MSDGGDKMSSLKKKALMCSAIFLCAGIIGLVAFYIPNRDIAFWLYCIALPLLFISLYLCFKYIRCPHCHSYLWRMHGSKCPHCGQNLYEDKPTDKE